MSLPAGATGADIATAQLQLFVNKVVKPGTFDVRRILDPWQEMKVTGINAPELGATDIAGTSLTKDDRYEFLILDVTQLVRDWVDGAIPNNGLALTVAAATACSGFPSIAKKTSAPATSRRSGLC